MVLIHHIVLWDVGWGRGGEVGSAWILKGRADSEMKLLQCISALLDTCLYQLPQPMYPLSIQTDLSAAVQDSQDVWHSVTADVVYYVRHFFRNALHTCI